MPIVMITVYDTTNDSSCDNTWVSTTLTTALLTGLKPWINLLLAGAFCQYLCHQTGQYGVYWNFTVQIDAGSFSKTHTRQWYRPD